MKAREEIAFMTSALFGGSENEMFFPPLLPAGMN
jgi:hypothetical protein